MDFIFLLDMTSAAQHLGPSQLVTHMFAEPGHKAPKSFTFGSQLPSLQSSPANEGFAVRPLWAQILRSN